MRSTAGLMKENKSNRPNRLKMKFELRRPVAIVKRKRKKYLVDKDCVRLPEKFYKYPEEGDEPIYIISRKSVKIPGYGEKWKDRSNKIFSFLMPSLPVLMIKGKMFVRYFL